MVMPWAWFRRPKDGVSVPSRDCRKAVEAAEAGPACEGEDPVFEGGGPVLLRPSFWEKAGWGVAVLAALMASGTASAGEPGPGFPRTSQTPRISLHVYGR
jgi:hypothetical protein